MSLGSILGVLFGFGLFASAIVMATDNYGMFLSIPSAIMVVGGTLAASFIAYQARYVLLATKEIGGLFIKGRVDRKLLTVETGKIIRWGFLVKKSGILALERELKSGDKQDHFLNYGVELVITRYTGDEVRAMLTAASEGEYFRKMVLVDILKSMSGTAPAFGMIGTLVGLIIMLQSLGAAPSGLGAGLGVATQRRREASGGGRVSVARRRCRRGEGLGKGGGSSNRARAHPLLHSHASPGGVRG